MARSFTVLDNNVDLKSLAQDINDFFIDDGFPDVKVDENVNGQWFEIQADKKGIARSIIAARKAIHVIIKGTPDKFNVTITTGEWGKNIAAAALSGIATMYVGTVLGVVSLGLNAKFTKKLVKFIEKSIEMNSRKNVDDITGSPDKTEPIDHTDKERNTIEESNEDPIEILEKALAKGEITLKDFQEGKKLLEK
ncbi:MAG: hypothetical protein HQ505_01920 [Nitrosopumilus sp.]|nr:hypothetical protein [Nitrosopumilus sp.]